MSAQRFEQVVKEAFPHLSSGQKKVAQYLLDSLQEASFQTAAEIGRASGVSETTVIRLSYSLGFQSFSQMHDAIQQRVMGHEKTVKKEENQNVLKRVLESELNIICRLENEENTQRIWEVVDRLIHASSTGCRIPNFIRSSTLVFNDAFDASGTRAVSQSAGRYSRKSLRFNTRVSHCCPVVSPLCKGSDKACGLR